MRRRWTGRISLTQGIYDDLCGQVACGKLAPGEPLPSSSELAEKYQVSVDTVVRVMERMKDEGIITGRKGDRRRVAERSGDGRPA